MGKLSAAQKQPLAEQMYMDGKSQKDIAAQLEVSENTLTRWKKEGKWEDTKKYLDNAPHRVEKLLLEEMERLAKGEKGKIQADALSKVKSALSAIQKELNPGVVYSVICELDKFCAANRPDMIVELTALHKEFLLSTLASK
jgi:transposase